MGVDGAAVTAPKPRGTGPPGWWTDTTLSECVSAQRRGRHRTNRRTWTSPATPLIGGSTWCEFDHAATNLAHRAAGPGGGAR